MTNDMEIFKQLLREFEEETHIYLSSARKKSIPFATDKVVLARRKLLNFAEQKLCKQETLFDEMMVMNKVLKETEK